MDPLNTNSTTTTPTLEEKSSVGATIAVLITLALLIIGGLYFWTQKAEAPDYTGNPYATTTPEVSNNDDLDTLEAELNATLVTEDSTDLDQEFSQ